MNILMSLYQALSNKNQFIQNMTNNNQIMGNPMAKNAIELMQKNDSKGLEEMAKNLCKERGISPDDAIRQLKQQLGIQ